jgi:predicted transposase YdaD
VETHMEHSVMLLCQILGEEEKRKGIIEYRAMLIVQKQIQHSSSQILRHFQLKSRLYRQRSRKRNGSLMSSVLS